MNRILPTLLLTLLFYACTITPEEAVIVVVACEPQMGLPDCRTVVKFGDGTLRDRQGAWGTPGDTITARKSLQGRWK